MNGRRSAIRWKASAGAALAALLLAGCADFPRIDPTGTRLFTSPPPPRPIAAATGQLQTTDSIYKQVPGRMTKHDRTAVTVTPARIIAPVGSEVVVQAAVCDRNRDLSPNEKVEWSLAPNSVGYFVQAGEAGPLEWLHHATYRTRKIDNTFAVSATSPKFIMLNRGTPNSNDDVPNLRGQAWVTLSSPVEGTSHVAAVAPSVYSWDARKQTSTVYWVDAQWTFPPPAINPAGTRHTFTTTLVRHSNKCPLAGYRVRYEIAPGGPAAGFVPNGAQVVEVTTNTLGQAPVEIFQQQPAPGCNTINIQVIRPADWPGGDGTQLVVGTGATQKTWTAQSAGLLIDKQGPREVPLGSTLTYRIDVRNPGDLTARGLTVVDAVPNGLSYIGSNPPATVAGTNLSWQLGDLAAGQSRTIELSFRTDQSTVVNNCATVTSLDGVSAQDCAATTITVPAVEVTIAAPPQIAVGEEVVFTATVTNRSATPAAGLVLVDRFDTGLRHEAAGAGPIENRDLGTLNPGETRNVNIRLRGVQPGRWCNTIELSGDSGIRGSAQACVTVVAAAVPPVAAPVPPAAPAAGLPVLVVRKSGPQRANTGDTVLFTIEVENRGPGAVTNLRVLDQYDLAMRPTRASDGWQAAGNDLYWTLPVLQPGQKYVRQVECLCQTPAARACNRAIVTTQEGVRQDAEACLEIAGRTNTLAIDLVDTRDPVAVGNEGTYEVRVTNNSPAPDRQIVVTVTLPNEMTPAGGQGPTPFALTGRTYQFNPIVEMRPGETLVFQVRGIARQVGTAVARATAVSQSAPTAVAATAQTNIVAQ